MKLILLLVLLLQGCASTTIQPAFRAGDIAIARNFAAYPQYNGTQVIVTGNLKWRWIKSSAFQGNALRVYEVTTVDGQKLAAQEFQLQRSL